MEFFKPERQQLALFDDLPVSMPGRKPKEKAPEKSKVVKVNRELAVKRYHIHQQLKGICEIDAAKRIIKVPYASFKDIPVGNVRYWIGFLIKCGYEHQYTLIS